MRSSVLPGVVSRAPSVLEARVRIGTACVALVLAATVLGGCSGWRGWDGRRERRGEDRDQRQEPDPDCRSGRGQVNLDRWSDIVEDFFRQSFRRRQSFRDAKQRLLDELQNVRLRACDWERRDVERLIDRVRNYEFRDAVE